MCQINHSLFVCHGAKSITILWLYLDDILVTGSDPLVVSTLLQALHTQFSMHHLGE